MDKVNIHSNLTLVLGPPGTGKTTQMLTYLDQLLRKGVDPQKVAFVSFTRKAANEARDRAVQKFNFKEGQFPWFRTLHSLAYRCLGLRPDDVMGRGDVIELGKSLGVYIDVGGNQDESVLLSDSGSVGTIMLFLDNLSRMRCETLRQTWAQFGDDRVDWRRMEYFSESMKNFKENRSVLDFTDMLERWLQTEAFCPDLHTVIVDEAQDLTQLQWRVVKRLVAQAQQVYVAGDDDQSIYTWSGADVDTFLNLGYKKCHTLETSYRLPKKIYELANSISGRVSSRYDKTWCPRPKADGQVTWAWRMDDVPLAEGKWLILVRNRAFMAPVVEYLRSQGYTYAAPISSPLEDGALDAIRSWEQLRKGQSVSVGQARKVYEFLKLGTGVARGFKTIPGLEDGVQINLEQLQKGFGLRTTAIWHEAMERIPLEEREYFIAVLRRGEKLTEPRIRVNTIHSMKGGEEENVLLLTDMARRTAEAYSKNPDPEHRVWYVGVTRARERLFLLEPTGRHFYPAMGPGTSFTNK